MQSKYFVSLVSSPTDSRSDQFHLEMLAANLLDLPDEILLEICKYLHQSDVLDAFYGLNLRLNRCISDYFHQINLLDVTYDQCHRLCSILSNIGIHVRLLSLSNCLSVLQGKVFAEYFSHRMSDVFPNLEKLILTCFTADEFERFLLTLNNLTKLKTIEIHDLLTDQSSLFQHLIESNEQRWTSVRFQTSFLALPTTICVNIRQLTIAIRLLDYFPQLLSLLPQIEQLNVTIDEISLTQVRFDHLPPIENLRQLTLRCYNHFWIIEEFQSLFSRLPNIEILSLQFSSQDERFVQSNSKFFSIVPTTLIELNIALRYFYDDIDEIDREDLRHQHYPLICLIDENLHQALLHTIPYRFPLMNLSVNMAKHMSRAEHYRHVEMFYDYQGMSLVESLPILSRCKHLNEIAIQSYDRTNVLPTESHVLPQLPLFRRLKRIWFLHSAREYQSLRLILQHSPNLRELFISFDNISVMFDDNEMCELLATKICHLLILRSAPAAPTHLNEKSVTDLLRIFTRIRHLQIDVTHGTPLESIVLAILRALENRSSLISLVVEGNCLDEQLKIDARQWLIDRGHFRSDDRFDAQYKEQTKRFLLWKSNSSAISNQ